VSDEGSGGSEGSAAAVTATAVTATAVERPFKIYSAHEGRLL